RTIVCSSGWGGAFGGGGCGASASRPCGTTGEIAMKIISRTSRISIMGVMLISPLGPPEDPTAIAIWIAPLEFRFHSHPWNSRTGVWKPARAGGEKSFLLLYVQSGRVLVGEQTKLIDASRTQIIYNI